MNQKEHIDKKGKCARERVALLILLVLAFALLLLPAVSALNNPLTGAAITFSGIGTSISSTLNSYASSDAPGFIDFLIFSVIFFALCWVGFSNVFKDAQNANIALSVALGFALSIALVYGGKFTIKKLLPFAGVILFLVAVVLIYALLKKFVFTGTGVASTIFAVVVALLISLALLFLAWSMICSGTACDNNAFMKKIIGSDSYIGKFFGGMGGVFNTQATPVAPSKQATPPAPGTPNQQQQGAAGKGTKTVVGKTSTTNWWAIGAVAIMVLIVALLLWRGIKKRKEWAERYRNWREKNKTKKEMGALQGLLGGLEQYEKDSQQNMQRLLQLVTQEKSTFTTSRQVVDDITKDIKDTIGGEIELIKQGEKSGLTANIKKLNGFNAGEKIFVENHILAHMKNEMAELQAAFSTDPAIKDSINELENVSDHFDQHSTLIDSFSHYNLREKNVLDNMQVELKKNIDGFESFKTKCDNLITLLTSELGNINALTDGKQPYERVVEHVKTIRDSTIKLKGVFLEKIQLLHYIMKEMEALKTHVQQLHDEEVKKLDEFLKAAQGDQHIGKYDRAIYFAAHVYQNAACLIHGELDPQTKTALEEKEREAMGVISNCIKDVLGKDLMEQLQKWLVSGDYAHVQQTLKRISVDISKSDIPPEFDKLLKEYANKIKKLTTICINHQAANVIYNALQTQMQDYNKTYPPIK